MGKRREKQQVQPAPPATDAPGTEPTSEAETRITQAEASADLEAVVNGEAASPAAEAPEEAIEERAPSKAKETTFVVCCRNEDEARAECERRGLKFIAANLLPTGWFSIRARR